MQKWRNISCIIRQNDRMWWILEINIDCARLPQRFFETLLHLGKENKLYQLEKAVFESAVFCFRQKATAFMFSASL